MPLADTGYEMDETTLTLRHVESGGGFVWEGQTKYDTLGDAVIREVQRRMRDEHGMAWIRLPLGAEPGPSSGPAAASASASASAPASGSGSTQSQPNPEECGVFLTPSALAAPAKLLVLLHGAGAVRAGIWARKLCINNSLNDGSMLPYIARARAAGYAVVAIDANIKGPPGSGLDSPEAITHYVFRHVILPARPRSTFIVAHSYGGICTTHVLESLGDELLDTAGLAAIAFTDSMNVFGHRALSPPVSAFVSASLVNWAASKAPLGTPVPSKTADCAANLSASAKAHEWTSAKAIDGIFDQFDAAANSAANSAAQDPTAD